MADHPESRSLRTLVRAIWWLRGVGAVLLVLGGIVALAVADQVTQRYGVDGPRRAAFIASASGILLLPGIAYWVLAIFLRRRRTWAVYGTELVTWFQIFFAGAVILLLIAAFWPLAIVPLAWIGVLVMLLRKTRGCLDAIRALDKHAARGFEPVPVWPPAVKSLGPGE